MSKRKPAIAVKFPTADQVARIIVAASKAEGEDPIAVASGRMRSRARVYAFLSLVHDFPKVRQVAIMLMCGAPAVNAASMAISAVQIARGDQTKNAVWFDLDRMNAIRSRCGLRALTAKQAEFRRLSVRVKVRSANEYPVGADV